MAEQNPFQEYGNINETGMMNEYRAMRMMSMADRLGSAPRGRMGGGGIGANPMMAQMLGQQSQQPDYSAFTYDPQARAAAQSYLGQYGLSPVSPQNVKPNAVLPNSGFFGAHPRLSGMLEGGLFGAAATRDSATWGEGISNVAGGLLEGRMAKEGMVNRQFARPFQAAGMLEHLEDLKQTRDLHAADIERFRSEEQRWKDQTGLQGQRNQLESERNQLGVDKLNATRPVPVEGGSWVFNPSLDSSKQSPWEFKSGLGGKPNRNVGQQTREILAARGIDSEKATPVQIASAHRQAQDEAGTRAGLVAGGRSAAEQPYKNLADATQEHKKSVEQYNTQLSGYNTDKGRMQARKELEDSLWDQEEAAASAEGRKINPKAIQVTPSKLNEYIQQRKSDIQKSIDDSTAQFQKDYPQGSALPSSPKTGSAPRHYVEKNGKFVPSMPQGGPDPFTLNLRVP